MRFKPQSEYRIETSGPAGGFDERPAQPLDVVVPVTTPDLTRASIKNAEHLACGLNVRIRLVRVEIVPYPLQLASPPVPIEFLRKQLESYSSALPLRREVKLARDFEPALLKALRSDSIVLMTAKKRPWRTHNEWLAARLRRHGYPVILAFEGENHA